MGKFALIKKPKRQHRLIGAICDHSCSNDISEISIGVLPGEGIGPEIINAALQVLEVVVANSARRFNVYTGGKIGIPAKKESGRVLTKEVVEFCDSIFSKGGALLCGPGGGRFVYELRQEFDLFCKLTPLLPLNVLADAGVVKREARADVDIVLVRENTGGLYFGKWGRKVNEQNVLTAYQNIEYRVDEVLRILEVAIRLAAGRRKKLCLVVKHGGVPAISELWINSLYRLSAGVDIETNILEVDNAAFQLIALAHDYDVIVSPNMFGDVLADMGALLLGSRGMSYSANFNPSGAAVYQTGHGAAHDIAGTATANPIGQIMSLAMMLRESFALFAEADLIEASIEETLNAWRTADISAPGKKVIGTHEMACRIVEVLQVKMVGSAVIA